MKKRILSLFAALLFLLPLLASSPIHGADATSFDPTRVEVKAKGSGGVPVGMILAWPVGQNPEDMDNWLECNGQSISPSVYPELFAVVGNSVPDLRGLFLRGHGGNSAALGVVQRDAIRNLTADFGGAIYGSGISANGVFKGHTGGMWASLTGGGGTRDCYLQFDASRQVPTAEENRPVNTAVRFLVRARP